MFPTSPLTDGYTFHILSELIDTKTFTMLSNSFPVRDMALFGNYEGKEMYVNRGTAGIDGIMSTTFGLAEVLNKPGVCFIGDIAFLHDSNALLLLQKVKTPLIIVLLNNEAALFSRCYQLVTIKNDTANISKLLSRFPSLHCVGHIKLIIHSFLARNSLFRVLKLTSNGPEFIFLNV